jgi:fido (protein-threonine AMPylation protein)
VIDGTDLPEEWGEENLELDGTNDVEWADDVNRRGREYEGGKYLHWSPFAFGHPRSRRAMWQSYVRSKKDRLDWTKPSHVFTTQYHIIDTPDSWTVLSDDY